MADTSATKERVRRWAHTVQDKAATRMVNRLSARTPGGMERDRRRSDTISGDRMASLVVQGSGGEDRPDELPEWLDEGVQFEIEGNPVLVFRIGAETIFARRVLFNREQRSKGFWSDVMTADNWHGELTDAAASTDF